MSMGARAYTERRLATMVTDEHVLTDEELKRMRLEMCQEGLLYISFFSFALLQLITGYQMYIARLHYTSKVL